MGQTDVLFQILPAGLRYGLELLVQYLLNHMTDFDHSLEKYGIPLFWHIMVSLQISTGY